ncbi:MAG: hypothetical protein U1E71_12370 [Ramlibacter sp.]|jgi:predicted DNA-binding protein
MTKIPEPTAIERFAGSLPMEGALTTIAAVVGTPLAALLPVLGKSLAAERQRERVERTLREMNDVLAAQGAALERLTDQQYKFINEAILALVHTTSEGKMAYLRNVVVNSLQVTEFQDQEAAFLSRIVRDISVDEASFLISSFGFERLWLNDTAPGERKRKTLAVKPQSPEGQVVLGLVTLGLVTAAEPTYDESGLLRFTPMAAKLIALLRGTRP